jgi:hypothetical protein
MSDEYEVISGPELVEAVAEDAPETVTEPEVETEDTGAETEQTEQTPEQVEEHERKSGRQREREKAQATQRELAILKEEVESLKRGGVTPKVESNTGPKLEQFETVEDFLDARDRAREEARKNQERAKAWEQKEKEVREKHADFDEAFDGFMRNRPSRDLGAAIMESPVGPEIARFLGLNPGELQRINALPPLRQAAEIGKIEYRLTEKPKPTPKTSTAPPPINPVRPVGKSVVPSTVMDRYESY